ncbi:MAG: hypothetical protein WCJ97_06060 [Phycisphaerae bacterium]
MQPPPPALPPRYPATGWLRPLLMGLVLVAVGVGIGFGYRYIETYSDKKIQTASTQQRWPIRVEILGAPPWLDQSIIADVKGTATSFIASSMENYNRIQNPLDKEILLVVSGQYTEAPQLRSNAWVRRIQWVRRIEDPKQRLITIQISAEFRRPVVLVRQGDELALVDEQKVRLPGTYRADERKNMLGFFVLLGIPEAMPQPGSPFVSAPVSTGLQMVQQLTGHPWSGQIDSIDLSNLGGQLDKSKPHIVLNTHYNTQILWGRPPQEEKFFEVSLPTKLKALSEIYMRYGRVDARTGYVDIRFEQVHIPRPVPPGTGN